MRFIETFYLLLETIKKFLSIIWTKSSHSPSRIERWTHCTLGHCRHTTLPWSLQNFLFMVMVGGWCRVAKGKKSCILIFGLFSCWSEPKHMGWLNGVVVIDICFMCTAGSHLTFGWLLNVDFFSVEDTEFESSCNVHLRIVFQPFWVLATAAFLSTFSWIVNQFYRLLVLRLACMYV